MKKPITKVVAVALLTVFIFPTGVDAGGKYSPKDAADYARKWAESNNPKYYYFENGDCTNFVSQCIVKGRGGKMIKQKKIKPLSIRGMIMGYMRIPYVEKVKKGKKTVTIRRWYGKKYNYKKFKKTWRIYCHSTSFTVVKDFHKFWKSQNKKYCKKTYRPKKKNGVYIRVTRKNSAFQKALKRGDIIQVWESGLSWHHSMIVTSGKKGNWKVCYHTPNKKDVPLYKTKFDADARYRIIRIY